MGADVLEIGSLVQVRGQRWVVSEVSESSLAVDELAATVPPGRTLVTLTSVSEDDIGEELSVIWEVEPGRSVIPSGALPDIPEPGKWDDPEILGALVDAVRWGTVASADVSTLQAPFRAGIQIKDYQLEPVARALRMPRVALLVADDVGLGKTIEAGLVIEELLLRHRARRVMVVCPASLTTKWRDEMRDKFGLGFTVLDAAALKELRRSHGLQANPFTVYPRMIVSLSWLRTPRVQRLLDEVLDATTLHQGFFDLLVVDEAHHCAPPAPSKGRRGYAVELADPRRFARGVEPDRQALGEVLVRRLKDQIVDADGNPEFAQRLPAEELEVLYSDAERDGHRLLGDYAALRTGSPRRNDLVTLLLKKRLFSSPAAFARTLERHAATVTASGGIDDGDDPLDTGYDWDDEPDDTAGSEAEAAMLAGAATSLTPAAASALATLRQWAAGQVGPADSKAERLVAELDRICRPGGDWNDERVIVFTEYVDTQTWLAGLLGARGLGGERLALLSGGMDPKQRDYLKAAFQAAPHRHPVRILVATDATSEGIDLQEHCCRVINYDIPFNPNRLEQRIGRVDRFGQRRPVHVSHFVGAGWQSAPPGSFEADLEFLSRVAAKVAQEREDLGRVNPVLSQAVEARMLGRLLLDDPFATPSDVAPLRAERDLRDQVKRLRAQLESSTEQLHVAGLNIRRATDTALALAGQPPLVDRPNATSPNATSSSGTATPGKPAWKVSTPNATGTPVYQAHGATHLILARRLEDRAELDRYRAAVPGAEITVCQLTTPEPLRLERLHKRMPPGPPRDWHLARNVELEGILADRACEDCEVENGDRPIREVALEVLSRAGWLPSEDVAMGR